MAQTLNFLALDLGAESGRAMLGRFDGEYLELTEQYRFPNGPVTVPAQGQASRLSYHWDILRLWENVKQGIARVVRQPGLELAGIGLDTWGVDFGLLDRRGALIGAPYHYRDSRNDGMLEEAFRRMPRAQIFELTGIQFMQINTLCQLLSMVVNHDPALEIARTFLTIPDLLNYWLTGRAVCEFTNTTTTQLYDPRRQSWAKPLMEAMGIPVGIFPEVIQPGTLLGPLSASLAEELSFGEREGKEISVVAPATHDTGSAVAAVPALGRGFAWISSGTWSVVGAEVSAPVINAASLAYNFTNEGGVAGTFRLSKNVMGLWLLQECRRAWQAAGEELSYTELIELAREAVPFRSLIDPDDTSFLKPGDMPARILAYCKQTSQPLPESQAAMVRCILESIALKYRLVLERLESLVEQRLEPIHIVGGGSQNRLLCQMTADATGRVVIAGPVEATALGNILLQAITLGALGSLADARAVVRRSSNVETFMPGPGEVWEAAYAQLIKYAEIPDSTR